MDVEEVTDARSARATAVVLFGCLFAAQSALIVLSPILADVAADLRVSTATAGQLRAVTGVVSAVSAFGVAAIGRHLGLRDLLTAGLAMLVLGSAASALAQTFPVLVAAQVGIGVGLALVVTGGVAAAAVWAPSGTRGRVLALALLGQPAAWIVGMPLVGVIGELSWRPAWAVPATAAALTLAWLSRMDRDRPHPGAGGTAELLRMPGMARWVLGELLAFAGWAGMLIYAGAVFAEVHRITVGVVGLVLAGGAVAYLGGNLLARRWVDHSARLILVLLSPAMAAAGFLVFALPSAAAAAGLFTLAGFLGGARTIASSSLGLDLGAVDPLRAMGLRTSAVQFGYLAGAGLGGLGLAWNGWRGLGAVLGVLLAAAALPHLRSPARADARNG